MDSIIIKRVSLNRNESMRKILRHNPSIKSAIILLSSTMRHGQKKSSTVFNRTVLTYQVNNILLTRSLVLSLITINYIIYIQFFFFPFCFLSFPILNNKRPFSISKISAPMNLRRREKESVCNSNCSKRGAIGAFTCRS